MRPTASNASLGSDPEINRLDRIRSVALNMFVNEGYQAVSLRQIALEIGVQAGSLYNHIEGKQALLFDMIEEYESALLYTTSRLRYGRDDVFGALSKYLTAYLKFSFSNRDLHILSLREYNSLDTQQKSTIDTIRAKQGNRLKGIVNAGASTRLFQVDDLDIAVAAIRAMLDGVVIGNLHKEFQEDILVKRVQRMIGRSLTSI